MGTIRCGAISVYGGEERGVQGFCGKHEGKRPLGRPRLTTNLYDIYPVAYRGGVGVFKHPPPRNSEGPTKNRGKLNPIAKTVKTVAEFRMPIHQDVRKKGSKILKLRRFAIVLY